MKLCFATNNKNKLEEVRQTLGTGADILSLQDIGCYEELPETHETLDGNSSEKAAYVHQNFGLDCFADDTGLEVEALGGAPGVYSARYAGDHRSSSDNIRLLLSRLQGKVGEERKARFRTVITLFEEGEQKQFEGVVEGHITTSLEGEAGFGYDPVFVPKGYGCTFAQMGMEEKNKISHRGVAVRKLVAYLAGKIK